MAFCTGIGWLLRRLPGAVVALLAGSIPCTVIVILATALFSHWQENQWAQAGTHGAIAAAVAITVKTCWTREDMVAVRATAGSIMTAAEGLRST